MTSKERAELRSKAHSLQPLFQVGKGGVNDALIQQTADALRVHELIKLKVLLETCPKAPKEIATEIAQATGAEIVGVIGGVMIFYKYSEELHEKEKQKKKNIKVAEKSRREAARNKEKQEKYGKIK